MPTPTDPIARLLDEQDVLVLDGGLATELEARGRRLESDLWSAEVLTDDPGLIRRVHADYLAAGADVVTTATYQATEEGFRRHGLDAGAARRLIQRAVDLACEARDAFWADPGNRQGRRRPLVAASVGPYGAYLADGSEYRGDDGLSESELADFHRERLRLLAASGADLLACETLPSRREAQALLALLEELPEVHAWFSFTCRDGRHLADGTPLADVTAVLEPRSQVVAVGVNCVPPGLVEEAIRTIRHAGTGNTRIVVYPNSGEGWDAAEKVWTPASGGAPDTDFPAARWRDAGATLIGGCCRTSPADIRRLRQRLLGPLALPT